MKIYLKEGDQIFATGVFLTLHSDEWHIDSFEDDSFFNGVHVETEVSEEDKLVKYFIEI